MCDTDVCIRDWISKDTKFSSRVANRIAASSATRGWNNCDLLLSVAGSGAGRGNTGNTGREKISNYIFKNYYN